VDDEDDAEGLPDGEAAAQGVLDGVEAAAGDGAEPEADGDGAEPEADGGPSDFEADFEELVDGANIADVAWSDEEERDAAARLMASLSGYPRKLLLDGETCAGKSVALAALAHSLRAMGAVVRPGRPKRIAALVALFAIPGRRRGGAWRNACSGSCMSSLAHSCCIVRFSKSKRSAAPHMPRVQPLGAAALRGAAAAGGCGAPASGGGSGRSRPRARRGGGGRWCTCRTRSS